MPIVSIHKLTILVSNDHIIRWQLFFTIRTLQHDCFQLVFNISGAILFHINKLRDNLLVRSLSKSPNTQYARWGSLVVQGTSSVIKKLMINNDGSKPRNSL